jgi:hypothetical protein
VVGSSFTEAVSYDHLVRRPADNGRPVIADPLLDRGMLGARITTLRSLYADEAARVKEREDAYLTAYSPPFTQNLGPYKFAEHDQWNGGVKPEDVDHTRSSFNVTRPVVEIWASLEADLEFPKIRFVDTLNLPPAPLMNDPEETARRESSYVARKLVGQAKSTMREQVLYQYVRRSKLGRHYFRTVLRKNRSGHAWMRLIPKLTYEGEGIKTGGSGDFLIKSNIDNSTVMPVWTDAEEGNDLDSILVVSRRSAARLKAQYPVELAGMSMDTDGITVQTASYYQPTVTPVTNAERRFVWVEDYWLLDADFEDRIPDGPPIEGRVINAIRVNGVVVQVTEYPGWKHVPYFHIHNDNGRDRLGFSDAGTMLPIQDGFNRMLSEQADVIHGGSRTKWLHKAEPGAATPQLNDEGVTQIDVTEDFGPLRAPIDVFPTQVHGQQLGQIQDRATGLVPTAWGEIPRMSSGRAMAVSAKAVAGRMVPRLADDADFIDAILNFMLDCMELYEWDSSNLLYGGDRDFVIDFPNQDSRDQSEITLDAINQLHANLTDTAGAMVMVGEESPDERLEAVRRDLSDPILHREGRQQDLMIARLEQQIQLDAANAQQQAAMAAQAGAGATNINAQQGQANQAAVQAQQQGAPTLGPGQNAPASQPGVPNQAQSPVPADKISAMMQNGNVGNRIIVGG